MVRMFLFYNRCPDFFDSFMLPASLDQAIWSQPAHMDATHRPAVPLAEVQVADRTRGLLGQG